MSNNTGGPAFPQPTDSTLSWQGMTLRDYFAAKAMHAWVSTTTKPYMHHGENHVDMLDVDRVAELAYGQADAMLKAREQ